MICIHWCYSSFSPQCYDSYRIWVKSQSWWRHQMETFSTLLTICVGNSPVNGDFPTQRPVPRSFDVFFDLRLNKRLSKQSWGWWFETSSCPLKRHCNGDVWVTAYDNVQLLHWCSHFGIIFFKLEVSFNSPWNENALVCIVTYCRCHWNGK